MTGHWFWSVCLIAADINECEEQTSLCPQNLECLNIPGSFICSGWFRLCPLLFKHIFCLFGATCFCCEALCSFMFVLQNPPRCPSSLLSLQWWLWSVAWPCYWWSCFVIEGKSPRVPTVYSINSRLVGLLECSAECEFRWVVLENSISPLQWKVLRTGTALILYKYFRTADIFTCCVGGLNLILKTLNKYSDP